MSSNPADLLSSRQALADEIAALSETELDSLVEELNNQILSERVAMAVARCNANFVAATGSPSKSSSEDDGVMRFVVFADIAGRVSMDTEGNPRVTSGAVAVPLECVEELREEVRQLPKWKCCTQVDAARAVSTIVRKCAGVSVISIDKTTDEWAAAIADGQLLHREISSESGPGSGWAKPTVLLVIELLSRAGFAAVALTLRQWREANPTADVQAFEFSIVCDTELSGEETVALFKSFWNDEHIPVDKLSMLGYTVQHRNVELKTEQEEPLLLLADYAAGLAHSAHLPEPGRIRMPVDHVAAKRILGALDATGKLLIEARGFNASYDQIYGHAMVEARARRDTREKRS